MRTIRTPRLSMVLAVVAALAPLAAPAGLHAQVPTLDRVDSLLAAGDYDDARAALDRWWSAREQFDVPGSDRARALMLRARLAPDADAAEPDYLAVVLGYPTSDHAPEALLRLGQGLLVEGDAVRAAAYLQRLVTDYPGRPQRTPGLLWLSRANSAARRPAAACAAARQGLDASTDPDLQAMLRVEEGSACGLAAATPAAEAPAPSGRSPRADRTPPTDAPTREAPSPPAADPAPRPAGSGATPAEAPPAAAPRGPVDASGPFSAQTGAFRYREGADALMARLRAAGYQPRAVVVPSNALLRIRVGRFDSAAEAARLVARLKAGGFDAYVVRDADRERQP